MKEKCLTEFYLKSFRFYKNDKARQITKSVGFYTGEPLHWRCRYAAFFLKDLSTKKTEKKHVFH